MAMMSSVLALAKIGASTMGLPISVATPFLGAPHGTPVLTRQPQPGLGMLGSGDSHKGEQDQYGPRLHGA